MTSPSHHPTRRSLVFVIFLGALVVSGCTKRFICHTGKVEKNKRIGVLQTDKDGKKLRNTLEKNYIYQAIHEAGLTPVALNDVVVTKVFSAATQVFLPASPSTEGDQTQQSAIALDPKLVGFLQPQFKRLGLDYVMVLYTRASGLDEELHGVIVRVEDMQIVASEYYVFSAMKALWTSLSFIGVSYLVVPWFYTRCKVEAQYEMLSDFLADAMK